MTSPGACTTCLDTYTEDDFGTDGDGNLVLNHVCGRVALERNAIALPRYEQKTRFGLMECVRCQKVIQRRRMNQRTCLDCSAIVRKEADAQRWRNRGAA